jgi:tetratricopeptide (TPR) repeat protein
VGSCAAALLGLQKERSYSAQQLCLLRADAANELFKAGESAAAISAYSSIVLADCPQGVKFAVHNNRGALHLQQGRAEAALADFCSALDVTPGNIDALHNKASVRELPPPKASDKSVGGQAPHLRC